MNDLRFYVVIPAHNEEKFIGPCLDSLLNQSYTPHKIIVVNDCSTDGTRMRVEAIARENPVVELINNTSEAIQHLPGAKVVRAFDKGCDYLDENYDVICKFDADLIFPNDYFEVLNTHFKADSHLGLAGGFCSVCINDEWVVENLANDDHLRGALKAYRKKCFQDMGGLKKEMGWDTVDEMLARFNGWSVKTIPELKVKHRRPTGESYRESAKYKKGYSFYRMGYGFLITLISSVKSAFKQRHCSVVNDLKGYFKAKHREREPMVSPDEARFIRRYRWRKMREKLF